MSHCSIVGKRTSRENHSAKPLTGNKVRRAESIQKDMGMSTLVRVPPSITTYLKIRD